MTFNGVTYQTIIEMERLIVVTEQMIKMYNAKLKVDELSRNLTSITETKALLNIQVNFLNELKTIEKEMLDEIDIINNSFNDIESKIFICKFVNNMTNKQIKYEFDLADTTYDRYCANINKKLNETETGQKLLKFLKEESD